MFPLLFLSLSSGPPLRVIYDAARHTASVRDGSGKLKIRLSFAKGCRLDRLDVMGREVVSPAKGLWSAVKFGGRWLTSANLAHPPKISATGNQLRISGIEYGEGVRVVEGWTFTAKEDSIRWEIRRRYLDAGMLEDTAMPQASFSTMDTWTGALLGTGGVAWGKLLDAPNATYGVHTGLATFWNPASNDCLRFSTWGGERALRFTREADGSFAMAASVTAEPRGTKHDKARFQRHGEDVWAPFAVTAGQEASSAVELSAFGYQEAYGRGEFKGLNTSAITELLNTIGRIGVIDEGLVGSNGWYSGYVCMHEPWLARVGTSINDPHYVRACSDFLDFAREHAIQPDGMVKSRWCYNAGDAAPGTYDANGFYEAQWGRLMDSQTSYVTNVADQFDLSGDKVWVRRQKGACEAALEYLLRRDSNSNHLVEMANDSIHQKRSSDWLDIVWASHENAFVNAQLYGALRKWSAVELVLGDAVKSKYYHQFGEELKASFNNPISEGGFWNPEKGWYVYWRDRDGSVHGDNLTIPVNLTALGEGLCDDRQRRERLLGTIEARMKAESLLSWPACFEGYAPGEGADDVFPTYENGDIFLAWAEYGVRAYAATRPDVALKYVRQIVDQYKKDGLAFQRYLRASGKGAGDDILANNCNVITGLYRDIYGIQPKYNRLYLEPHLVPSLDGTRVDYDLRGMPLSIDLATDRYRVSHARVAVESVQPFGVDFEGGVVRYFAGDRGMPTVTFSVGEKGDFVARFPRKSSGDLGWEISTESPEVRVFHSFPGLKPGFRYHVVAAGKSIATVSADSPSVTVSCKKGHPIELTLARAP